MVVEFPTTCATSAYHHLRREFEPHSWRGVLDTMWFPPGTPVSFTNNTARHDITEILLKVALNTTNQSNQATY